MNKQNMEFIKKENNYTKLIRTEILFTPLLIILPIFVSILLIFDWYIKGFLENNTMMYNGELLIGVIILVVNFFFDIPFIKSLKAFSKKNK
jgi:hypothetical protein